MDWKAESLYTHEVHAIHSADIPGWTQADTADYLGLSTSEVSMHLQVAEAILSGDENILHAEGLRKAYDSLKPKPRPKITASIKDVDSILRS